MKSAVKLTTIILILFFACTWIAQLKYDLSVIDYLRYSMPITQSEKLYLQSVGNIIYGIDKNAPPISFTNNENGQQEGLIVDYMSSLSIELGVNFICEPLVWNEVLKSLNEGTIHMADLFASEERSQLYDFSQNIYSLKGVIATKIRNSTITSTNDISNLLIAIPEDDYATEYLQTIYQNGDGPKIILANDISECLVLLNENKVDAIAGDETVISYFIKNLNLAQNIHILNEPLYQKDVTIAVNKEYNQLLSILNKGILTLKKKNILVQIQQKWFGIPSPIIIDHTTYKWTLRLVGGIIGLIAIFYFWNALMRKKIEEKTYEIEIQKESLRTIIDALKTYLLVIDPFCTIIECNEIITTFLKTEKSQIIGKNLYEINILGQLYRNYIDDGRTIQNLNNRYYNIDIKKLNDSNSNQLVSIEDITEKTISEKRMRQESKMVAVGQLSAGLAHEIRNPLGLIRNYTYVLKRYIQDDLSQHAIDILGESVNRINDLIEHLLGFSRLGKETASVTHIKSLIDNILTIEEKKMQTASIEKILICEDDLYFTIDEEALKIILFNLINNAIDALCSLETSTKKKVLYIDIHQIDNQLIIIVDDNGIGIPEETLELIFNPFYTTKDSGTGLGLYLVNFELERINGSISIQSSAGLGTRFYITIPTIIAIENKL